MRLEARLSYALIGLVQATGYAGGLDCPKPAMADRIASRKESEKPGSPRVLARVGCFFYPLHRLVFVYHNFLLLT